MRDFERQFVFENKENVFVRHEEVMPHHSVAKQHRKPQKKEFAVFRFIFEVAGRNQPHAADEKRAVH